MNPQVKAGLWIRIGSGFNRVNGSGFGIRIRIQEGKNDQRHKSRTFFFKVHVLKCWMASFES
jgi:hypothetical protein